MNIIINNNKKNKYLIGLYIKFKVNNKLMSEIIHKINRINTNIKKLELFNFNHYNLSSCNFKIKILKSIQVLINHKIKSILLKYSS